MADIDKIQDDLFGFNPKIENFTFNGVKLGKDGAILISASANSEAADIAMLKPELWRGPLAMYLLKLCHGDLDLTMRHVKAQYLALQQSSDDAQQEANARKRDAALGFVNSLKAHGEILKMRVE